MATPPNKISFSRRSWAVIEEERGVVIVNGAWYARDFYRVSWSDIEAIKVEKVARKEMYLGFFTILMVTALIFGLSFNSANEWGPFSAVMGGLSFGLAMLILFKQILYGGFHCQLYLKTPSQLIKMRGPNRWNDVQKLVAAMEPKIQAHQKPLSPAEWEAALAERQKPGVRSA